MTTYRRSFDDSSYAWRFTRFATAIPLERTTTR
jgi:hypothetical protein